MVRTIVCLGAMLSLAGPTSGFAAPMQPRTGYYTQLWYVLSASVTGSGQCTDAAGTYYTEQYYYPGPSASGAMEWRSVSLPGLLGNIVITLPETPPSGATSWTGTYKSSLLPGGSPSSVKFTTNFTLTDAFSAVGSTTITYPTSSGGTCTESLQFNQAFSGKS